MAPRNYDILGLKGQNRPIILSTSMAEQMNIEYLHIGRPFSFSSPFSHAEFAALVYVNDMTIMAEEQATLSDQLVAAGCRYAVCAGHDSSSWDDSIDAAYLRRYNWDVKNENFVMTSWHGEEPFHDIVFFLLNNTSYACFSAERMLILVVGGPCLMLDTIREEIGKQTAPNGLHDGAAVE